MTPLESAVQKLADYTALNPYRGNGVVDILSIGLDAEERRALDRHMRDGGEVVISNVPVCEPFRPAYNPHKRVPK